MLAVSKGKLADACKAQRRCWRGRLCGVAASSLRGLRMKATIRTCGPAGHVEHSATWLRAANARVGRVQSWGVIDVGPAREAHSSPAIVAAPRVGA